MSPFHGLHHAFHKWFKETDDTGLPALPHKLAHKYRVLEATLGQGSFAVVKPVVLKETGEERALKVIAKKPLKESNEKMLKEEIRILERVHHPNVIRMYDVGETKEAVFIITDICRGGELFDRLVEKTHYNEIDARRIMRQIFSGVDYLHRQGIIHRDLKPENILLRHESDDSEIVISDFGLSRILPDDGLLSTACGSPQYVSPEVLLGHGYGPAVDTWSAGVIAYCLLGGYSPFYGEDQPTLFQNIVDMKYEFEEEYWSDISEEAKDFISRCLSPANVRMSPEEALNHPWLHEEKVHSPDAPKGTSLTGARMERMKGGKEKLKGTVDVVESIHYLQRLASLRARHGAQPERLKRLKALAVMLGRGGAPVPAADGQPTLVPPGWEKDGDEAKVEHREGENGGEEAAEGEKEKEKLGVAMPGGAAVSTETIMAGLGHLKVSDEKDAGVEGEQRDGEHTSRVSA